MAIWAALLVLPLNGQVNINGSVTGITVFGPLLPNLSFPGVNASAIPMGDTDLYTVPIGRKALLFAAEITNPGSTLTYYIEAKISGTYYRLQSGQSAPGSSIGTLDSLFPMLLNAGESVSVNTTAAGLSLWCSVYEFDAASNLSTARLLSPTSGNNTLLTITGSGISVPPAMVTSAATTTNHPWIVVSNSTGGARSINVYAVPNGGSPGSSNLLLSAPSLANNTVQNVLYVGGQEMGGTVVYNTDSSAAGQFVWMIYVQE